MLLANLHETAAADFIGRLYCTGSVGDACRAYREAVDEDRKAACELLDRMDSSSGKDFHDAAVKMLPYAKQEHLDRLLRIREETVGSDRDDIDTLIKMLICKYPKLYARQAEILSS